MTAFVVGDLYTRDQVADAARLPADRRAGGDWMTGYSQWKDEIFIFTNVNVAGRTGHDYPNEWDGKRLIWYGKTRSKLGQPQMNRMLSGEVPVHLFWRANDRVPFTYAGHAIAVDWKDQQPVQVVWEFEEGSPWLREAVSEEGGRSRRGPPPAHTPHTVTPEEGPSEVYVMRLYGPINAMFPNLPDDHVVIKVGYSRKAIQRLSQLNAGFPPGSTIAWKIESTVVMPSRITAFEFEGKCLERLRLNQRSIGGEYAIVPQTDLAGVLLI